MDILTHTLSGLAIGTVVSSFSNRGFKHKLKIVLVSGLAGALPDLDAISLWSGFDSCIGNFFNLSSSGKEIYSGKMWYSHHAFLHSLSAAFLIASFIGLAHYFLDRNLNEIRFTDSLKKNHLLLIGVILGYTIHLIEDMPTPASTWGGVNFLWPSNVYVGGTGNIWWWNNYDIFLIVVSVILLNLLLTSIRKFIRFTLGWFTTGVFMAGFVLALVQIKSRDFDFAYSGHAPRYQEYEAISKQLQRDILGDRMYLLMENFDNKLSIYF